MLVSSPVFCFHMFWHWRAVSRMSNGGHTKTGANLRSCFNVSLLYKKIEEPVSSVLCKITNQGKKTDSWIVCHTIVIINQPPKPAYRQCCSTWSRYTMRILYCMQLTLHTSVKLWDNWQVDVSETENLVPHFSVGGLLNFCNKSDELCVMSL